MRTGPVHARDHVTFAETLRDSDRLDPVVARVCRRHRDVVRRVAGKQQAATQRPPQFLQGALRDARVRRSGVPRRRPSVGGKREVYPGSANRRAAQQISSGELTHLTTSTEAIIPRSSCARTWQCSTNLPVKSTKFDTNFNESPERLVSTN